MSESTEHYGSGQGTSARPPNGRLTIGLLTYGPGDPNNAQVWAGADDAARDADANLLCFPGRALRSPVGFDGQASLVYALIGPENVDGVVVWGAALTRYVNHELIGTLCEAFDPLPTVCIGLPLKGIPSVLLDNYSGMHEATAHLIEAHDRSRIAFIRGPVGHPEAEDRYRAFADALNEHSIPLDPSLVVPGDFSPGAGVAAIRLLIEQRRADLDAIVAANDAMALGAMQALGVRGIRIPEDVAVVGFDDIEESKYAAPPLTSVRLRAYEQAALAVQTVLSLLRGERAPDQVTLPTALVIRQSCGCPDPAVVQAAAEIASISEETLEIVLARRRAEILSDMSQAVATSTVAPYPAWMERLLESFCAELRGEHSESFSATLNAALRQAALAGTDIHSWQGVISALRRYTLPCLRGNPAALSRAQNLWHRARVAIGGMADQARMRQAVRARKRADMLRSVGQSLVIASDMTDLNHALVRELPRLGVPSCYVSLYEDPATPIVRSRLVLAYDERGEIDLEPDAQSFPSPQITPAGMHDPGKRFSMSVEPLYFRENQLGLGVLELGPEQADLCEPLRAQLSTALQGILSNEERREAQNAAQRRATQAALINEIGRRVGSELKIESLLPEIATGICDAFGYYNAMLLLLDDEGQHLTLESVAGSYAGMFPDRPTIAVGEGMMGHAAATGKIQISGDVSKDPHYVRKGAETTNSELAVPIISGQSVIGILDLQSDRHDAFDETDVMLMQTLADQIAVAIKNARLYEDVQRELAQRKQAEEAMERRATQAALTYEAGRRVSSELELGSLLSEIVAAIHEAFDYYGVMLLLLDEESERLILQSIAGGYVSAFPDDLTLSVGEGMIGHAAATGTTQVSGDVHQNPHYVRKAKETTRSELSVPIRMGQEVIGVLDLQSEEYAAFDEADVMVMETLADQVAVAIRNARLYDAVQRELAERRRAEQELLRLKEFNEGIVNTVAEALLIEDAEGIISFVNPAIEDLIGYKPDELVGCHWRKIVSEPDLEVVRSKTSQRRAGRSDRYEIRLRSQNGQDVPVLVSALPLFENGAFVGVLSAITDITEQKRAEEQLRRYAKELEESNEEVKQFAYIVSHDLRGPLVNMKGFSAELRSSLESIRSALDPLLSRLDETERSRLTAALQEDVPEALDFIDSSATRMDRFISALLRLSRLGRQQLTPEPVDMNQIVRATLDSLAHQMAQHQTSAEVAELPTVIADRTSMEQIVGNILDNAVKYLTPDRPGELTITSQNGGDEVTFLVRDNGRGIAESDLHKVFAPFRRAGKQDVPGEGMGLAYAQMLVRRHGGRLSCESELGAGTTFSFTLPNQSMKGNKNEEMARSHDSSGRG